MNLSNWSDVCRIIAIVGSSLAVLGTIGHYAIGKVLDRQKSQRIEQLESSNISLRNDLAEAAKRVDEAREVIDATREYVDMAPLNLIGKPYPDGDLVYATDISKALEGSYKIEGTKIEFLQDEKAENIYRSVIAEFPRFPFAYWALAGLLAGKGDESWRNYAEKCISILEKTTKVAGHHPNHDQKLTELRRALGE